jgi:hypothetical protein
MLARHRHLWQRAWAVQQLARRATDPAAAAALAAAVRGADYFLTRAQAAEGLSAFPAAVAVPALEVAAHDTAAQVRESAVAALGRVGGEGALAVARRAWLADSSDQVRAAALLALARLGAPDARAAVLEGLGLPSYRDAIQNAAITLAVQHGDPELVAALGRVVGSQSLPAIALAALASRGDTAARGLLRAGLDDERPWVREWVLGAVEQQLDPGPALGLLREAQPSLTRAEARSAVAQAIGRLERPPS